MKVLIVAKTRRGPGACVGGIAEDGRSVRLVDADSNNPHAGLEYEVGDVWEVQSVPDPNIIPPHVENILVLGGRKLRPSKRLVETVRRFMPPACGGPDKLFEGLLQTTSSGGLYIAERAGVPSRSTMFWVADQPLEIDYEGKRIRYRYRAPERAPELDAALTYVGFQEPVRIIPAGTLLRISLAHWWRPTNDPKEEPRCFLQLSGWYLDGVSTLEQPGFGKSATVNRWKPSSSVRHSPAELLKRAEQVLKRTFGFPSFLPVQREVISRILQGRDALVVMPTGGGKSLCYQLPSLIFDGLTVVVSPLVALMHDQVRQLRQTGAAAACLNHMVNLDDYTAIMSQAREGRLKLLYVAPETLLRPEILLLLEQSRLACLAIDEAHCISEWGHDFRPEYRQLQDVRRRFPAAICVALTATATPRVRADIRRLLEIPADGEFVASFNRPNLFLRVEARTDALGQILDFLQKRRGESGIIYCGTRKDTDALAAALQAAGWPAVPYHAGLPDDIRCRNQERFIRDEVPLIVATIAFGMGINKSNVRFVVHAHLPKDIESYYQEIGRAGRDGLPAQCLLLYSFGDAVLHRRFIRDGAESEREGRERRLACLLRFAQTRECRRKPLLAYFNESIPEPCGTCDNCIQAEQPEATMQDVSLPARKFLNCVQRTGQCFGQEHLISVLRGSRAARVLEREHERLPEYGAGKAYSAENWRYFISQLLRLGFIEQGLEFGGLRLTKKGREALRNTDAILIRSRSLSGGGGTAEGARLSEAHGDEGLFEELRTLRRDFADRLSLPPYVIFSDRSLREMATQLPQDPDEFLEITGVGEFKLEHYGEAFIEAIRAYCRTRAPSEVPPAPSACFPPIRQVGLPRFQQVGELFAGGADIHKLAREFNVQPSTILSHLERFQQFGGDLEPARVKQCVNMSEERQSRVVDAFDKLGSERLSPVHQELAGAVDYEQLRLVRLFLRCSEKPGRGIPGTGREDRGRIGSR